ncbi:methyltransferase domain-containing protein [Paraphaeosphaeria minitans]|uniref:Methyltransferase domain-containing protein n=1 Tax=Paraphaeosphaeria minitans TaxID=565426 RepID=A0A9P6KQB5_9PLEO|nr:methyltransferase domain-containing protein [Paraphaeosphaeria minitans]
MACCFGQGIRQLVADGAPPENIFGCDLRKEYVELGYQLFRDHGRLHGQLLTADIFEKIVSACRPARYLRCCCISWILLSPV